jgi:hypothetical protein
MRAARSRHAAHERGVAPALRVLEEAIARTRAVIARPPTEVLRLSQSDREIYATYYQLSSAGVRVPEGNKWDTLRQMVDAAAFPGFEDEIRFGALSLDGGGPANYGVCGLVLRTDMIAHRATVFEENTVLWYGKAGFRPMDPLPAGYRTTWDRRQELGVAKLGDRVAAQIDEPEIGRMLQREGDTTGSDDFIEVHVFGPVTIRTCEEVTIRPTRDEADAVISRAVLEVLPMREVPCRVLQ